MKWIHSGLGICTSGLLIFACAQTGHVGDEVPIHPPSLVGNDAALPASGDDAAVDAGNACTTCPALSFCENGSCRCPVDQPTVCGNTCVDVLTDDANCGSCGHACTGGADGGGPVCKAGVCRTTETFSVNLGYSTSITADDQALYVWGRSNVGGWEAMRAEKTAQPLAFTSLAIVRQIYGEATYTAATLAGNDFFMGSFTGLFRVPKTGGELQTVSSESVLALAASATHLYVGTGTSILRMALPDGELEPFLDFGANFVAVRGDDLYAATYVGYPPTTPAEIYYVDIPTRRRLVIGSTTCVTSLAPTADGLLWTSGLFVDRPVYSVYGERKLLRWTKAPRKITSLVQNPFAPITGVASDGVRAYFTNSYYWRFDQNAHALSTVALAGQDEGLSAPMNLATALDPITAITPVPAAGRAVVDHMRAPLVDGSFLYWLEDVELQGTKVRRISLQ